MPLIFDRVYITVVAGREKRNPARLAQESRRHPLRGFGYVMVVSCFAATIALAGVAVVLLAGGARLP